VITYDYILNRINENRIFIPEDIPKDIPNLVLIEGPNSRGKSTLLHIIALSMFANKNEKINPALLNKMNLLINSDHQNIKFNLEISDKHKKPLFHAEKKDFNINEIILKENINNKFELVTHETFESKYNLIYDIPNNPIERLKELLNELKDEQQRYGNYLLSFHSYLYELITDISKYRDPDRLSKLKSLRTEAINYLKKINEELPSKEKFLSLFEKFVYTRFFIYYYTEKERLLEKINKYEENVGSLKGKIQKADKSELTIEKRINQQLDNIFTGYKEISPKLFPIFNKTEKIYLEIWKKAEIHNIKNFEFDSNLKKALSHFINTFDSEIQKLEANNELQKGQVYNNIFEFLKRYENEKIIFPKLDLTIKEFIDILKSEKERYDVITGKYNSFISIQADLCDLQSLIESLNPDLEKLKKIRKEEKSIEDQTYSVELTEPEINSIKERLKDIKKKYDYYEKLCLTKDINIENLKNNCVEEITKFGNYKELEPFFTLDEKDMDEKIISLRGEIHKDKENRTQKNTLVDRYDEDIKLLEKREPHKYENYKIELNELLRTTEILSQKLLSDYAKLLRQIQQKPAPKPQNEFERTYYDEVSKYLGSRMGSFGHIDKIYHALKVDLISEVVHTFEGIPIYLSDMGTGQSQTAYLLALLNVKNDNRKIIALFDDVAMIDDPNLSRIIEKFRDLYREDKLLFGIIVQMNRNEFKVTSLLEEK
jgi:exonuclease SbcC